jgi:hypothetical protein
MSTIRKGDGERGLLLRCLTEAIGKHDAIKADKAEAVRNDFITSVNSSPEGLRSPERYNRHLGEILKRIFPNAGAETPATAQAEVPTQAAHPAPTNGVTVVVANDLASLGLSVEDIGIDVAPEENPYTKSGGALEKAMDEWISQKLHAFPYFRVVMVEGKRYAIAGTASIRTKDDVEINVGATRGGHGTIQDADETVHVFHDGRRVTLNRDLVNDPKGSHGPFWVRLLHHRPGHEIRFWINRKPKGEKGKDALVARCMMDDSDVGFTQRTTRCRN